MQYYIYNSVYKQKADPQNPNFMSSGHVAWKQKKDGIVSSFRY